MQRTTVNANNINETCLKLCCHVTMFLLEHLAHLKGIQWHFTLNMYNYIIFKFQIEAWEAELAQNQECHVIVLGHSNMYKMMNFWICWVSRNGLVSRGWISRNLHGGMHDLQENQNFRMDSVFRHSGGRVAAISNSNRFYPATHRIRNNQHTFLCPSLCVKTESNL